MKGALELEAWKRKEGQKKKIKASTLRAWVCNLKKQTKRGCRKGWEKRTLQLAECVSGISHLLTTPSLGVASLPFHASYGFPQL